MTTLKRTIERFVLPSIAVLFMTACLDSNITALEQRDRDVEGPSVRVDPPPPDTDGQDERIGTSPCSGRAPDARPLGEDFVCPLP